MIHNYCSVLCANHSYSCHNGILEFNVPLDIVFLPQPLPSLSVGLHLFCGAGHEKRRDEQLKWSLTFSLYIGSFPCAQLPGPVRTSGWAECVFCVFSLGLYFVFSSVFL